MFKHFFLFFQTMVYAIFPFNCHQIVPPNVSIYDEQQNFHRAFSNNIFHEIMPPNSSFKKIYIFLDRIFQQVFIHVMHYRNFTNILFPPFFSSAFLTLPRIFINILPTILPHFFLLEKKERFFFFLFYMVFSNKSFFLLSFEP